MIKGHLFAMKHPFCLECVPPVPLQDHTLSQPKEFERVKVSGT